MMDSNKIISNKYLQYKLSYFNQKDQNCRCNDKKNGGIIIHKKKFNKRKKHIFFEYSQQPPLAFNLSIINLPKKQGLVKRHSSMPEVNKSAKTVQSRTRSTHAVKQQNKHPYKSKFIVNTVSEHLFDKRLEPFNYSKQNKCKIYRCQLTTQQESCCCSCNSDAMFEVMKSLYDCYKKKNCDNCDCILCGHLCKEERLLGEMRKSLVAVGLDTGSAKVTKEKVKKAEKALEGKTTAEKLNIIREMAQSRQPLPEGKTLSEKSLIKKIRDDLGLPPQPKTTAEKAKMRKAEAAGIISPLEGKAAPQKEKILKAQAALGIPLPERRTPSEKALIQKIKAAAGIPLGIPSEKLRKARAAGLITPLEGKSQEQKEKILKGLAMHGISLPEGKTPSEKKLIDKVRADLGLPPEPKTNTMKDRYTNAANAGLLLPLEGKSPREKERMLQGLADLGIPLPEGRTTSEKSLVAKVKAKAGLPLDLGTMSEKLRQAKAAGLLTPLKGKSPEHKEKILKGLANQGISFPEGQTPSERKLINKVRADLGLPPEPKIKAIRDKHEQAAKLGLLQPLEGKTPTQKEKILQGLHNMGLPLPEGRTPSEKVLVAKIKTGPRLLSTMLTPSEKMRRAKAAGLLTPLKGKSQMQKENILKGLARHGIALPDGQTPSEKKLIDKVRADLGLPPQPKTAAMRDKYAKAVNAGLMQPLDGKSPKEKEKILKGLADMGIPLPEGRTPSEKRLVAKVARSLQMLAPSEKMRRAKADGLLTPLKDKTPAQKEKILRGLAEHGLPLPEGQTPSEKNLINKVRADLGFPIEPKTQAMRDKYAKAANAGLLESLEGTSPKEKEMTLKGSADMGIPLPEVRTPSEKALVAKIDAARPLEVLTPLEKTRRAKAEGLLTPLKGKTPAQKEKILKGLAGHGLPLPEAQTSSEKNLIDKVRGDLGLPPTPKTQAMKDKYAKAADAGLLQPLEGKSPKEKERILQGLAHIGIPLPEGRTPSEKALIAKIKSGPPPSITTEKIRKAKAAGLFTPLAGKTPEQKEKILKDLAKAGLPLPAGKTPSEKALINQIKKELGKPQRTPSEKLRKAKAAGFLTPLEGKTPMQKDKILRGRVAAGLPLPEGRTLSERVLVQKIKDETGNVTPSPSERLRKAKAAGLLTPLKGKLPSVKDRILKDMLAAGVPIREGETPSEKKSIKRLTAGPPPPNLSRSERLRHDQGLLKPLEKKTLEQKRNILTGLLKAGLPLPEPKTESEKELINKIREEVGLPPEPKTPSLRAKYDKALAAGLITPLEGKTPLEKENYLKRLLRAGLPLPAGRTPSEKSIIKRVKAGLPVQATSAKLKVAKVTGLLTPLEGQTPAQKEKILRGLAKTGIPLPEGKTPSEKDLISKIRTEMGLPPEPQTPSLREKMRRAQAAGIITPLEGKTPAQKKHILKALTEAGIPLPEGRTPSEKSLIAKVHAETKLKLIPSEKIRKAKTAGLLTPLEGKTPEEKERIMRGLAEHGLPLPEAKTASEKKLAAKIRKELGLPPAPKTPSMKERHENAATAGVLVPLKGLSSDEKERVLKVQVKLGLHLPEGRTPSEKSLIAKVRAETQPKLIPSEKMRKAKAAGLLTPLEGKTSEEKERIMRGLAKHGLPLPEAKTASEKQLAAKIRKELGLPPAPKTPSMKVRHENAAAAGVLVPLEGLTPDVKEKVLKVQVQLGLHLPEGRTSSEKSLIAKVKAEEPTKISSEKLRKAKAAGLLTPLEGKTPAEKEKIVRGLAEAGLTLPEGKTLSEKYLIHNVRTELGIPPLATTASEKSVIRKAKAEGLFTPIVGKSPTEKERILRGLAEAGLPLPVGKTASEKELIKKVRHQAGLALEPSPSEKMGKIKTKSKKIGVGEAEAFEDVIKTGACDRGCGCEKKKIRFKHSYVKIRVTSPDISALCSCPEECLPGAKAGAFIDNEGIKVTVRSAVGVPNYLKEYINHTVLGEITSIGYRRNTATDIIKYYLYNTSKQPIYNVIGSDSCYSSSKVDFKLSKSRSDVSRSTRPYSTESDNNYMQNSSPPYERRSSQSETNFENSRCFQSSGDINRDSISNGKINTSSLDSILVIKSEISLSLTTSASNSTNTISVMSAADSSITSKSTHYSDYRLSEELFSITSDDGPNPKNIIDFISDGISDSDDPVDKPAFIRNCIENRNNGAVDKNGKQNDNVIYRLTEIKVNGTEKKKGKNKKKIKNSKTVTLLSQLTNHIDVTMMVNKLLSKKDFSGVSSIFIVVPTSDNDAENTPNDCSSTIIKSTDNDSSENNYNPVNQGQSLRRTTARCGEQICGRAKRFYMQEIPMLSFHDKETMFNNEPIEAFRHKEKINKLCQITLLNNMVEKTEQRCHIVSTDTTEDRPCCCHRKVSCSIQSNSSVENYVPNVISRQITHLFLKQGLSYDWLGLSNISLHSSMQASYSSMKPSTTRVSPCIVPPCSGYNSCHIPSDVHQRRYGNFVQGNEQQYPQAPLSPPCQCDPENLKVLLEQATEAVKSMDITSLGCGGSGARHTPVTIASKGDCTTCIDIEEPKCGCDDKSKSVKLRKLCPCQQHHRVSKKEPGPKMGMTSMSIMTDLKGSDILVAKTDPASSVCQKHENISRTEEINRSSSKTSTKKTRFSMVTSKLFTTKSNSTKACTTKAIFKKPSTIKAISKKAICALTNTIKASISKMNTTKVRQDNVADSAARTFLTKQSNPNTLVDQINRYVEQSSQTVTGGYHTQAGAKTANNIAATRNASTSIVDCKSIDESPQGQAEQIRSADPNTRTKFGSTEQAMEDKKEACKCYKSKAKMISRTTSNLNFELQPQPQPTPFPYEAYGPSCGWIDTGEIMKMRSDMTVTTSGFKMNQKKKNQTQMGQTGANEEAEIELDFEDAIRYYASMNPERFRDLMQQEQKKKLGPEFEEPDEKKGEGNISNKNKTKSKSKKKGKGKKKGKDKDEDTDEDETTDDSEKTEKKDVACNCPYGPIPPPISYEIIDTELALEEAPVKGFKFSIGGKGACSPGLGGICCFDMTQESYTSW